ncbi:thioredoxin family protein [Marinilongibacter aquaticus]|uniref:thioredoxin family protein n=1 Tax=Marinilongibacter aquaticus TaxID=2975157 RepID=UPI0021BD69D2|nr:thioredoxin family protein [Marinilongibacter aquaticus]UBM60636.1 thioredoxin family protein [Marinilongibacter aquaticus]
MARTESKMLPLGTKAPDFALPDTVSDKVLRLEELKSEVATVIMFICNHCPFVKHINAELVKMAQKFIPKGVSFIAISSNDVVHYPADSPENMKAHAKETGYPFPYLYDESQEVAQKYDAACTPDFYIFDKHLKLAYRGRMDASTPGNDVPVTGNDLRGALRALIENEFVSEIQYPSVGCGIKWKKG